MCEFILGGLLLLKIQCAQIEIKPIETPVVEEWSYAIGMVESGFKICPQTCEISHNYWGRKSLSGGYMNWSSDEQAWADQEDYLQRRIEQGYDTIDKLGPLYAEDPNWPIKVKSYLQ
jgi:hypothetical protein